MAKDPLGYAPGDEFDSIEDAAIDFSCTYNEWSIKVDSEYATRIYSYQVTVCEDSVDGFAVIYDKTRTIYRDSPKDTAFTCRGL